VGLLAFDTNASWIASVNPALPPVMVLIFMVGIGVGVG
jgi:hypothetical protein